MGTFTPPCLPLQLGAFWIHWTWVHLDTPDWDFTQRGWNTWTALTKTERNQNAETNNSKMSNEWHKTWLKLSPMIHTEPADRWEPQRKPRGSSEKIRQWPGKNNAKIIWIKFSAENHVWCQETWGTWQDWLQCNCWVWTRGRAQVLERGEQRPECPNSRGTQFLPPQRGKSPRKAPCCRLESCCSLREHKTTNGCGRSRDKTKNRGGKQSGNGWGRIQFGVTSVIYECLYPHILYLKRKAEALSSGAGYPHPRAAGFPGQGPCPWDGAGATVTLGRDRDGTLGCWNGDSLLSHPTLQKCVLLWRRESRGESEN